MSSRLELLEKFSVNNFALSDAELFCDCRSKQNPFFGWYRIHLKCFNDNFDFLFLLCRIILITIIVIMLLIENLNPFFTNCYILKSNFLPWNYIIIFQNCWHFLTYWIEPGWNEIYTLISLISCYIWYSITQDGQTKNDANLVFMIFNFHGFMKTLHCINKKLKF